MKVVIQRTTAATVLVKNKTVGSIDKGIVVLVGFTEGDTIKDIEYMVNKIINLRIFDDEKGIMNISLKDINGSVLSISQFTLYADTKKGRRPSYTNSLKYEQAEHLYKQFNAVLEDNDVNVAKGIFGAEMAVKLINDGPVTIIIDSND